MQVEGAEIPFGLHFCCDAVDCGGYGQAFDGISGAQGASKNWTPWIRELWQARRAVELKALAKGTESRAAA